jgi:general secretion pathway protein B
MSSILKALRRLEEERARKSDAAPEIAANLLRRSARRRSTPLWIWPTIVAVVALALAVFFWSWRLAPVGNKIVTPITLPADVPVAPTTGQGGEVIIEEVIDQRRPGMLAPVKPPLPVPAPVLPAQNFKTESIPAAVERQSAATFIEVRQSPVITAIAWQDDSASRMAVVDGLPVMTGEFVDTAKVQEILRDRIIFAEEGRIFTVLIDPH